MLDEMMLAHRDSIGVIKLVMTMNMHADEVFGHSQRECTEARERYRQMGVREQTYKQA